MSQLPGITELLLPVLQLAGAREEVSTQLVTRLLADQYGITIGQDSRLHMPGDLKGLHTRVGWAINYLKGANLLITHRYGSCQITPSGREILANPPKKLTRKSLGRFVKKGEEGDRLEPQNHVEKGENGKAPQSVALPGIFYEVTQTEEGDILFNHCPQPLLPVEAKPGAFFESIVLVKNAVSAQPSISAEELYQKLTEWAGQYHPNGIQVAFDALSMAGVVPQKDWTRELEMPVVLTMPETLSLAEMRKFCLHTMCCRMVKMSAFLHALTRHPQPGVRDLFALLDGQIQLAELNLRVNLLADLGAVICEALVWRLTPIGRDLTQFFSIGNPNAQPTVIWSSSDMLPHQTKEADNSVTDSLDEASLSHHGKTEEIKYSPFEKKSIDNHIFTSLREGIRIIFPHEQKAVHLIKKHFWNNTRYVGVADNSTDAWKGWSANLSTLATGYGTIYIDLVNNILPYNTRSALFGEAFSKEVSGYKSFIVIYEGNLPLKGENEILKQGFAIRKMGKTIHASFVVEVSRFYQETVFHWAAYIARLIMFSKELRGKYQDTSSIRSIP